MPILPSCIDSTPRQIKRNADKKKKVGIGKPSLPLDQENYFLTIFRSLLALSPYSIYFVSFGMQIQRRIYTSTPQKAVQVVRTT